MKIRQILIVTYDWPPRNSIAVYRPYAWAKYWSLLGCRVTVLTAKKYIYDEPLDLNLQIPTGVEVIEVGYRKIGDLQSQRSGGIESLKQKVFGFIKRHSGQIQKILGIHYDIRDQWAKQAIPKALKICNEKNIDIVVSTYGPRSCHFIGSAIKEKYPNIKWVADYRDLWSIRHNSELSEAGKNKEKQLEREVVKDADYFLTVSEPLAADLSAFLGRDVEVVFNGFDDEWDDVENRIKASVKNREQRGNLVITYTGMIYPGLRDPSPLFLAINDLIDEGQLNDEKISVNFYGHRQPGLKELVDKYSATGYVKIHGHVTREDALEVQKNSDLLLLLESGDDVAKGVLTGKIFEYLASGVPILSLGSKGDSAIGKLIFETCAGAVCASDVSSIKKVLLDALCGDLNRIYDPNFLEIKKYSRKTQAENLLLKLEAFLWTRS
jgi:glycosyltransferase involved in cell wall biosynthesis